MGFISISVRSPWGQREVGGQRAAPGPSPLYFWKERSQGLGTGWVLPGAEVPSGMGLQEGLGLVRGQGLCLGKH